jgi:Ca2+-binding RTX toxin-like protein
MARRISGKARELAQDERAVAGAGPQAITYVGGEVRVNTATQFNQISGKGAALAGGGFVVVWDDASTTGGATGDTSGAVKLQLFDAEGAKVGTEIRVNTATANSQGRGAVTALANGGFVVTWEDYSEGVGGTPGDSDLAAVKAQIFTATGTKVGVEILVNSNPAGDQIAGPPVALSGGGFVVSWNTFNPNGGYSNNLRAEVFAADGTRVATGLAVDEGINDGSTIIALDGNRFAVLWTEIGVTTSSVIGDRDVRLRIYDGNGVPAGESVVINGPDSDWQIFESVAKVAGGGFVATWEEQDLGGTRSEIMAQRFDGNGAKLGTEFQVNTVTASYQLGSRVSGLAGGGFVITWVSQDPALDNEVRAQVYNAAGAAIGGELNVNTATAVRQDAPRIVALEAGGFVILWADTSQGVGGATGDNNGKAIKGQEFDAAGVPVGTEFLVNTAIRERQEMTDVIDLPGGRFAVIWDDASQGTGGATGDTSGLQVKLQILQGTVAGNAAPVAHPDAFTIGEDGTIAGGNLFADNGSGADSDPDGPALAIAAVNGSAANVGMQIVLASGALLTVSANGNFDYDPNGAFLDTPAVGSGASNTPGHDSFTYALAGGNTVTVSIALTGADTNDVLIDTAGDDVLAGGAGNDTYFLTGGSDQVIEAAGGGFDAVYAASNFVLGAGQEVEWLSTATYYGAEALNLTGNGFGQYLLGSNGANVLDGGGGADILVGYGGDDIYYVDTAGDYVLEAVGGGSDTVHASVSYALAAGVEVERLSTTADAATGAIDLAGNEFANELTGNAGANVLKGAGGADIMVGLGGNDTYYVDDAGDAVIEAAGEGFDALYAGVSFVLGAGQEVDWLSTSATAGTDALNLTGNALGQYLIGNEGANVLDGGDGADIMLGYGGADIFAFTTMPGGGNLDTIVDFVQGVDRIALDDAVFAGLGGPGPLDANAFVTGAAALDADDRLIYNQATGQLFYDADGSGAGAAVHFATLQGAPPLGAGDFVMI